MCSVCGLSVADIRKRAELNPRSISDSDRGTFSSPFIELNQFVTKNPSDARVYGIFRLLQRKETEAPNDFRKSLELDPTLKSEIEGLTQVLGRK